MMHHLGYHLRLSLMIFSEIRKLINKIHYFTAPKNFLFYTILKLIKKTYLLIKMM